MPNAEMTWEQAVQSLRDRPDQAELVRACYYDDPLIEAARRYHRGGEWQAIRGLIPRPPGRALDIGSGRGISAYAFAADGWTTHALEPDASDLVGAGAIRSLAAEGGVSITVDQEWGEALPYPDAHFDVVHCRAVLHHAHDLGQLCKEIGRVLKPGGTFVAAREHVVTRHEDIPAFQASHPLHALYGGEYAYLEREYVDAIEGAGLTITHNFNPMESDINLAPATMADIKRRWAGKFGLASLAGLVPDAVLGWRGARIDSPGRLYTFVARKPA
ncbi:class I SAM-dependent methyltransferase [uncultured Sphingomonas sp.]|uniref:class I SAM-dependent methyltransferase n=1 Tax=uncultured Sphingomonas sp. TaxID=158754 RepID=UPI0025E4E6D4|nr:class I SAM-dependent methyltransferase [uncultured Sphingomonas sp.]